MDEGERGVTLSDVPLCCCCLSLQVVSYHACVCGLFHSYMLYTVSLSSQCRLSVVFVFVVRGLNLLLFFSPPPFRVCSIRVVPHPQRPPPWQGQMHTAIKTFVGYKLKIGGLSKMRRLLCT